MKSQYIFQVKPFFSIELGSCILVRSQVEEEGDDLGTLLSLLRVRGGGDLLGSDSEYERKFGTALMLHNNTYRAGRPIVR